MDWNAFTFDFENGVLKIGNLPPIDLRSLDDFIYKMLWIVVIGIVMYIAIKVGNKIIDKMVKKQVESDLRFTMDTKKANTLGELLKSVLRYTVYFFGIAAILAHIFSGISLTFASIGGVAVGFGAQSLVKDLINGISILFEGQYEVGDHITLGPHSGVVESLGIRTTVLKDFSGDIHIIPNGIITTVTNHSRSDMRFLVDIEIAYEESIDNTIKLINQVCDKYTKTNDDITEPPAVLGVISLNPSGVTIRVAGKAKPMTQAVAERELRKEIKLELDKNGIEIPYPKTKIINDKGELI